MIISSLTKERQDYVITRLLEGGRGAVKEEFGRKHLLEFKGPFSFSFIFLDSPLFVRCGGPLNLTDVEHACSSVVNSLGSEQGEEVEQRIGSSGSRQKRSVQYASQESQQHA